MVSNAKGQGSLTPVLSFGSNPGSLNMYTYVPSGMSGAVPLVLALHGCTQTAALYATQSGWNKLANRHKFIVVYPEQVTANNSNKCFNWFDATDQTRDQGEALSIKQMVDYMKLHYAIDTTKIFVTGLSAGAGMTSVMLATYPEIFNKGAIMAGLPYKASSSSLTAYNAMSGFVTNTAPAWGDLVRNENPSYTGPFPHVAIFHGTSDLTVNINNATELIKQWTNVNNADQTADATNNSFDGNTSVSQTIYNNTSSNPVVYYYKITGMGHGIALDTGSCPRQGGATATYAIEENFHSTYWAAYFFGILANPYSVSGPIQVNENAGNITYSVVNTSGSTYTWTIPAGATIVSGQGTNSIVVNFGVSSGFVSVQETTSASCKNDIASLYVKITFSVVVSQTSYIFCHAVASASLSAIATGGTGSYTYSWSSGGGTNSVASSLQAGVYTVTVTDNASVVTSTVFTVTEPPVIAVNQTKTLCAGQTITIGSHTYSATNTYLDTLSAANGCDSVLTTHLSFYNSTPVSLSITGNDSLCSTDGAFVLSGGSPLNGVYAGSGVNAGSFNPGLAANGWNVITYTFVDANNCSTTDKDSLDVGACTVTGLAAALDISKDITVYPNPASGMIMVSVNEANQFELNLYNAIGELILVKQFNGHMTNLDIHALANGIYLLNVKTKQGTSTHKFMKN